MNEMFDKWFGKNMRKISATLKHSNSQAKLYVGDFLMLNFTTTKILHYESIKFTSRLNRVSLLKLTV